MGNCALPTALFLASTKLYFAEHINLSTWYFPYSPVTLEFCWLFGLSFSFFYNPLPIDDFLSHCGDFFPSLLHSMCFVFPSFQSLLYIFHIRNFSCIKFNSPTMFLITALEVLFNTMVNRWHIVLERGWVRWRFKLSIFSFCTRFCSNFFCRLNSFRMCYVCSALFVRFPIFSLYYCHWTH